ncbi:MAG: GAF domain-containing protein [Chloroflexota bacterium]
MAALLPPRPTDATLSVTKAARILGVHPNTVRAWSDAGRLRYYRINPRGDRRYRMSDLQGFLAAAEGGLSDAAPAPTSRHRPPFTFLDQRFTSGTTTFASPAGMANVEIERRRTDLSVIGDLARRAVDPGGLDVRLEAAVTTIREAYGYRLAAVWEIRDELLVARASAGPDRHRLTDLPRTFGVLGQALERRSDPDADRDVGRNTALAVRHDDTATLAVLPGAQLELAAAIPGRDGPWGVLLVAATAPTAIGDHDLDLVAIAADVLGTLVTVADREAALARQIHRNDALQRVAGDIGSRLDLDRILAGLVDHAMVLFEGDRAAVFLRRPDGSAVPEVSRGLSTGYLASVRGFPARSLPSAAVAVRQPLFAVAYRDDPRAAEIRAAIVQEGYDTICSAPLFAGDELLGLLNIYHDRPRPWTADELETMAALAAQASVAIKTAQNYEQMATWAAQLQSIQQLGARLNRLSTVREIGLAIATELRQLIDFHNVRVYRATGDDLVPVAMQGQVGEYVDETAEQLRVKVGEGITGWVAENRIAQLLDDAAGDPRSTTIPGTEDDLPESMLLAPMLFEEQVLGVLVLSKLGLHQFTEDDLRLLDIYASFAASAMANADATERMREQSDALERQLRSQRALLGITESILTTLDARVVLDSITDRIESLVSYDNIAIEVVDSASGLLRPLTARGLHASSYMEAWEPGETGVATWVVEHNEPLLIDDERTDVRVNHFRGSEVLDGALIVVPLRGREGATGVMTLERLGPGAHFTDDEFELVKLFAAQVSIALQNAEVYRAVEIRARTDDLTGLLNHGTFEEWLDQSVQESSLFSLIMVDLDDFRDINNRLGHQAGDWLLREIGRALVRAGRDSDLVFRYGGDEFTFLLPNTDSAGAIRVAERASEAVAAAASGHAPWAFDATRMSASIGVATYPDDGTTAADVLLAADRACFFAKRTGRGRIAMADEGLVLAAEFSLQEPTPVDPPTLPAAAG